jgi:hypothetical protein
MGKTALLAPLYVSVAWTFLVSYQLFTQTAVSTLVAYVNMIWPTVGEWLSLRIDLIVFVYAFAWVFLLSSVIPSVILGKERGVLVQFVVCLILTFVAFVIQDVIMAYGYGSLSNMLGSVTFLNNPVFAAAYLSTPYVLMLLLDLRSRKRRKMDKEF